MSQSAPTLARAALDELLDVSPQVDAVVLVRRGGDLLAAAPGSAEPTARTFGEIATQLLAAADAARLELGREPVTQVEVGTRDGHVFVVADADHVVAAVTDADPTVGLVFYDLKTALRSMREADGAAPGTISSNGMVVPVTSNGASEDDAAEDDDEAGRKKGWKRGKKS